MKGELMHRYWCCLLLYYHGPINRHLRLTQLRPYLLPDLWLPAASEVLLMQVAASFPLPQEPLQSICTVPEPSRELFSFLF